VFNSFLLNRAGPPGYFETIESVGQKAVGIWWFPPFGAGQPAVLTCGTSAAAPLDNGVKDLRLGKHVLFQT
jgi:hypothetical protein